MNALQKKNFVTTERDGVRIHSGMIGNNKVEIKETTGSRGDKWYHARANDNPRTAEIGMDEGGLMGWIYRLTKGR